MTDADVRLVAQPRLDTIVTEFHSGARRLRTDYVGMAWVGDLPDEDTGMMGPPTDAVPSISASSCRTPTGTT